MPSVILLDIDDVLSSDRSILVCREFDEESFRGYRVPRVGDPVAIELVNRACRLCKARVVISSSWLDVAGLDYTLRWLAKNGLCGEHLMAPDPCVNYRPGGSKREAIVDWCVQNSSIPADRIVVIDDDAALFPADHPFADRQVVIDGEDGLGLRHYRQIICKLGGIDRAAGVFGERRFKLPDE